MATISAGIAALASTVTAGGLRCTPHAPDTIEPPASFCVLTEITEATLDLQSMTYTVDVVVLVSAAADRAGQLKLYELVEPTGVSSVWRALDNAPTLGLTADNTRAWITGYRSLSVEEVAAYQFYGGAFAVTIST